MVRLTEHPCDDCGHRHMQYTSTGEWELAEKYRMIYTTGCVECDCKKFKDKETN